MPDKTRIETQRRPIVRPLGGAEVLVAVRGPSPGEGGGKNQAKLTIVCEFQGLQQTMAELHVD